MINKKFQKALLIMGIAAMAMTGCGKKENTDTTAIPFVESTTEAITTESITTEVTTEESTEYITEEVAVAQEIDYRNDFGENDRQFLYDHEFNATDAINSEYLGDLYDYTFVFDGIELAVPMDFQEFRDKLRANGWEYRDANTETDTSKTSGTRPEALKICMTKKINSSQDYCYLYVANEIFTPDMADEKGELTYTFDDIDSFRVVGFTCPNYTYECIENGWHADFYVTNEIGLGRSMTNVVEVKEPFYYLEAYHNLSVSDIYTDSAKYAEMRSPEEKRYYRKYGEMQDALSSLLPEEIPFCSKYIAFYPADVFTDNQLTGVIISCIFIYNNPYLTAFDSLEFYID